MTEIGLVYFEAPCPDFPVEYRYKGQLPLMTSRNYIQQQSPGHIVAFDCELSGPMLSLHGMVNLGAVLIDGQTGKTVKTFGAVINLPEGREWDQETVDRFWNASPELRQTRMTVLEQQGKELKDAMDEFVEFLNGCFVVSFGNLSLVANRLDVDAAWVDLYLSLAGYLPLRLIFRDRKDAKQVERLVDTNSFHQGVCRMTHRSVKEFESSGSNFHCGVAALKHLRVKERARTRISHNPSDDAENIGQTHYLVLKALDNFCLYGTKYN